MLFFFLLENKKNYFWVFTFLGNCWFHWICISKTKQHKKCCHGIFICLFPPPLLSITIEERHKNVTSVSSMFSVTIFHILFTIQSQRISSNCILFRHAPKWTFFLLHQMYPTQMLLRLSSMDYQISLSLFIFWLRLQTIFASFVPYLSFSSLPNDVKLIKCAWAFLALNGTLPTR